MADTHQRWRRELSSLVLGRLDPEEREALERHLRSCSDCRAEADRMAAVAAVLPLADPARGIPPTPPPDLEDRIVQLATQPPRQDHAARRRWLASRIGTGLAAAAVALTAAVVLIRGGWTDQPSSPRPPGVERVAFQAAPQGVEASAALTSVPGAVEVELQVQGMPGGEYVMWLEATDGSRVESDPFGAPRGNWRGIRTLPLPRNRAVSLNVGPSGGEPFLSEDLPPVS